MSRGAGAAALALGLAVLLAGCGQLAERVAARSGAASARPAAYVLEIDAPAELRALLLAYLDLARFRDATDADAVTDAELDRLVAAAPAQARALLETEGFFDADVRVARAPPQAAGTRIRVAVAPGRRALVTRWTLDVQGPLQAAAQAGAADAQATIAAWRRRWSLPAGEPFRQPAWSQAKSLALARLRAEGYAAAAWRTTRARVDADTGEVELEAVADSGPRFRLGPIAVEGLQRYGQASVQRLAGFGPGTPYTEQRLLDFQERLQKVGLFEGASVELDADPATADAAPLRVRVTELPLQTATVGVGYSANVGPRLTLEHVHRRPFGQDWIARDKLELGPSLRSWQGELTSHPREGLYRNLVAGTAERLRAADQLRTTWTARVGRTQDTPRIERLYFADYTHSRLDTTAGAASSDAASLNYHWIWRHIDSMLLPTRGTTVSLQGAGGYAIGRDITDEGITEGRGPFTRAYGRITWYRPIPDDDTRAARWYLTLRGEAGQVFARDRVGVPDPLLFRAGGDESVRGYAYRTLGPVVDGVVTSGRLMATGSVEIARPLSRERPQFWWAAFVDAGQAANRWGELDPALGYGVGLRWRSPVGPLRADLAYGQRVHSVRLHLSVGIAF